MKLTDAILKKIVLQTLKEAKEKPIANVKTSSVSEKGTKGSDSKGAKVSVKASGNAEKKQPTPNFKQKTTQPAAKTGDPFTEVAKDDAGDKFDKAPKQAAKVEKIATKGKAVNSKTGSQKGSFKAKATKPDEVKRIAKPAFTMKESYSKKDLAKFIYEQAKKSLK